MGRWPAVLGSALISRSEGDVVVTTDYDVQLTYRQEHGYTCVVGANQSEVQQEACLPCQPHQKTRRPLVATGDVRAVATGDISP